MHRDRHTHKKNTSSFLLTLCAGLLNDFLNDPEKKEKEKWEIDLWAETETETLSREIIAPGELNLNLPNDPTCSHHLQ